ncbi:NUDIX hydrolase [Candidatus Woesearchaeota archaeon]|nr:NUDIX hydrolase [Candidatus Woesearchaeota archaeon]
MSELSLPERLYQEDPKKYQRISRELYSEIHRLMPLVCVDGYVMTKNGVLLVKRKEEPAKDLWWPLGGRRPRGSKSDDAIKVIARRETGLDVEIVAKLGVEDTLFDTEPEWLNHGEGTDTTNTVYALRLVNPTLELDFDRTISGARIITVEEYFQKEKGTFHSYVDEYLPKVFGLPL